MLLSQFCKPAPWLWISRCEWHFKHLLLPISCNIRISALHKFISKHLVWKSLQLPRCRVQKQQAQFYLNRCVGLLQQTVFICVFLLTFATSVTLTPHWQWICCVLWMHVLLIRYCNLSPGRGSRQHCRQCQITAYYSILLCFKSVHISWVHGTK